MLTKIRLQDSVVIQTSSGPYTVHKHSPNYFDALQAETEEELSELMSVVYDTIYELYFDSKDIYVVPITADTDSPARPNAELIGRFKSESDMKTLYPEFFI